MVGAAGVDLFFVISGLVIGISTPDGSSVTAFLTKRFIRVVPLYWLATAALVAAMYCAWGQVPETNRIIRSLILLPTGSDWLPIYYPAWSLCYELAFYLVFAFAMAMFRSNTAIFVAIIVGAVAVLDLPLPNSTGHLCFEFVCGVLLSQVIRRITIDRRIGVICTVAALALFAFNYRPSGLTRALEWGVPSLLLIVGLLSFDSHSLWQNGWRLPRAMRATLFILRISQRSRSSSKFSGTFRSRRKPLQYSCSLRA
jgi:exopolysaccharide production protein ExoZ